MDLVLEIVSDVVVEFCDDVDVYNLKCCSPMFSRLKRRPKKHPNVFQDFCHRHNLCFMCFAKDCDYYVNSYLGTLLTCDSCYRSSLWAVFPQDLYYNGHKWSAYRVDNSYTAARVEVFADELSPFVPLAYCRSTYTGFTNRDREILASHIERMNIAYKRIISGVYYNLPSEMVFFGHTFAMRDVFSGVDPEKVEPMLKFLRELEQHIYNVLAKEIEFMAWLTQCPPPFTNIFSNFQMDGAQPQDVVQMALEDKTRAARSLQRTVRKYLEGWCIFYRKIFYGNKGGLNAEIVFDAETPMVIPRHILEFVAEMPKLNSDKIIVDKHGYIVTSIN